MAPLVPVMSTTYVPGVELVYVQVDTPIAPATVVHETIKPVLGIVNEVKDTSPEKPSRLVTVIVEVVDPAANDTVLDAGVSLKSGP